MPPFYQTRNGSMIRYSLHSFFALCLLGLNANAENIPDSNSARTASDTTENIQTKTRKSYTERVKKREATYTATAYESVDPSNMPPRKDRWSDFMPIFGREAREQGYVLPLPFGVSLIGLTQQQPFKVDSIGLDFDGKQSDNVSEYINGSITATDLEVSDNTFNLRFDTWILPFWNVYALAGKTEGTVELNLNIDTSVSTNALRLLGAGGGLLVNGPNRCNNLGLNYSGSEPPVGGSCVIQQNDISTKLNFNGSVLGYGTTVAGGYGDFFGMFDVNYTEADINIAKENSEQTVYSARIGWNGEIDIWSGQIWIGAMKQDIEQTLSIIIPGTQVSAVVEQHASSPINYLIGGQWNFTEEWSLIAETNIGFGDRQQLMFQLGYRM